MDAITSFRKTESENAPTTAAIIRRECKYPTAKIKGKILIASEPASFKLISGSLDIAAIKKEVLI